MKTIDHYDAIAAASNRMLLAARAGDLDALAAAEDECAQRIATLELLQRANTIVATEQPRRIHALRQVLAHDAEMRDLASPWLGRLDRLLAGRPPQEPDSG